ncbi:LTA synthase family protein [Robertmurraya korlensis]|uniref:LTA synthase family protein n=1 Tax=Robertmurraya korlensis TaxID=519977 RepID=UPI0008244A20|nr:alkaline phosphatase family protein [Robertmurraya korlensis]
MNRQQVQNTTLLITYNAYFALLFLFIIKLTRNNFSIDNLITWFQTDTKKLLIYFLVLFGLSLATYKLQIKGHQSLRRKYPWISIVGNYFTLLYVSVLTAFIINYFFQYFQWLRDPVLTTRWITENTRQFVAGVLYLQILFILAWSIIGNVYISALITSVSLLLMGFVHYNKLNLRTEPLYPMDFLQVGHLKEVIPMVSEYLSIGSILLFLLFIIIFVLLIMILPRTKTNIWVRVLLFVSSVYLLYSYTFFPKTFMKKFADFSNIAIVQWSQISNYEENGFLFGFLSNLFNDGFEKPADYSKANVLEVANKYLDKTESKGTITNDSIKPNIIYLMSEAFWDPTKLENVSFSGDPMVHLRRLSQKYTSGQTLSPVFGGATANVEFEALTGITTSFLKIGSIPFQEFVDNKEFIPTIVSDLENKGYQSLAIHPYNRVFYKRNRVYNTFGIDLFLDQETMQNKGRTPGGVISDESLTYELLESIKNEENPLFIHAVSMQNHMPYNLGAYEKNEIQVSGLKEESNTLLEVYTEGIRRTDESLQLLVNELEEIGEPTIVVFWGDHLPVLGANLGIYKEAKFDDEDQKVNDVKYYETPLLIYSNFDVPSKELDTVSPFFFGPIVYEMAGMEKPPFYNLLDQIRNEFFAIKGDIKLKEDRQFVTELTKEQEQLLEDYRLIAYDLLLGKQYSLSLMYNEK